MSNLVKIIGQRIRNRRTEQNLSQEKLAELSGCHPTYIGQIERGEKNATVESIEKISAALKLPLSQLFENLGEPYSDTRNVPLECYEFVAAKSKPEQEQIYNLLLQIDKYKNS